MSLLTSCPACTTIYKVVPDQLRISQGWVKCGQCGDIFDATQHLVHIESRVPLAARDQQSAVEEPFNQVNAPEVGQVGEDQQELSTHADRDALPPVEELEIYPPDAAGVPTGHDEPAPSSEIEDSDGVNQQPAHQAAVGPELSETPPESKAPDDADENALTELPAEQEPSFMRRARRALFWRRPWVRAALLVLALLLLLALVVQWVYRERQWLSASQPKWTPALLTFCAVVNCQVEPLQRIESVSIDVATLNKMDDTRYRLSFVLKNAADVPLAIPSIELTLTDLQERVVVRRVFSARELDSSVRQLRAASMWQVNALLALEGDAYARRVVGYRVLAFYP